MKTVLALLILGCSGVNAFAQDLHALPTRLESELQSGPRAPEAGQTEGSLELFFRYSMIRGDDGTGGKWNQDFFDGLGARVEGTVEYHFDEHWSLGGFAGTGFDLFAGKTSGGVTLDDWLVVPFTLGPKVKLYLGSSFFAEGYFGAGFVSYSSVDAKGSGVSAPVLDQSLAFAWEVGAHVGYKFNVDHGRAPTPQFGLLLGVGYEMWGAPQVNQSTSPGVSAKHVQNLTFDFGFWFGF